MSNKKCRPSEPEAMRDKAEALMRERTAQSQAQRTVLSPEETQRTLHELQVHQVELEMQNEALQQAQAELEISRTRYFELYDRAPVGYCTLSEQGLILEANLTAGTLLNRDCNTLVETPISHFILQEDQALFDQLWKQLFETGKPQEDELRLVKLDGTDFWAHLTASLSRAEDGTSLCLMVLNDITEHKRAEAEIHHLAHYDMLTHLPNRRLFQDRLSQAMAGSQRSGVHGALVFMDIDNFKTLNDTRGHDVGDQLLITIGQRLLDCVREGDTVARLGGDEFVVMLEDLSEEIEEAALLAGQVGEKIRLALACPYEIESGEHHHTASLGIAMFRGHEKSVETLLKHADLAMYNAKDNGRNAVHFFDPAMQTNLDERTLLETELRSALALDQLALHYQAQIDSDGQVLGAEMLLRWSHPTRGMILPDDFIPMAEATGLILPIGHWVLKVACRQIAAWSSNATTSKLQLAVNISAQEFRQLGFVTYIRQLLEETGANPERLKLELTEGMVLDDVAGSIKRMQALKELGIGFALDDFGTGYSSLSYLTRLPLETLKIDSSFVFNLPDSHEDAVITQTIISMARSLGLKVIAEGVETEAQRAFLPSHHCHVYQGFLFSRPVPLEEFESYCRAS